MYLDNILLIKNTDSSFSYSEILMDSILVSESVQEAEAIALTTEFSRHTLGSEAASDWWPKIKAFFRKIWENLKRLLAKAAAYILAIPAKLSALVSKVLTMWHKRGLDGKAKNLWKNLDKKIVGPDANAVKDFENTDWGAIPCSLESSADKVATKISKDVEDAKAKMISRLSSGGSATTHVMISLIKIIKAETPTFADEDIEDIARLEIQDNDSVESSQVKDSIVEVFQEAMDFRESSQNFERKYKITKANLEEWIAYFKNDRASKDFKKYSHCVSSAIESLDRKHQNAMKDFERLYKEEDEDGVKFLIAKLKVMNQLTMILIGIDGVIAKICASQTLNLAKMTVAAIKCFTAEGKKNTLADGTRTQNVLTKPSDQNSTPSNPDNKGKPFNGNGASQRKAEDDEVRDSQRRAVENAKAAAEAKRKAEEARKSVLEDSAFAGDNYDPNDFASKDPDFAAFLKM